MKALHNIALIFCVTTFTQAHWETARRSRPQLLGGWRQHKYPSQSSKFIRLAYHAFSSALGEPSMHGISLRVSKAATQVVAGLNYKLEVELAKVSCGFQHPHNYEKWHYAHNLVCFSGQVVAVCNIDFYHGIGTVTPNITSFKCNEPLFD
uniref:Putative tick salivary cystatin n=1 Tax=Rhipicephalus pulchellus TaxID=72859 RepID=L7LRB4_RHIPC